MHYTAFLRSGAEGSLDVLSSVGSRPKIGMFGGGVQEGVVHSPKKANLKKTKNKNKMRKKKKKNNKLKKIDHNHHNAIYKWVKSDEFSRG